MTHIVKNLVVLFLLCTSTSIVSFTYHFIIRADDSSVFIVTCRLKSKDILESYIGETGTRSIRTKINTRLVNVNM